MTLFLVAGDQSGKGEESSSNLFSLKVITPAEASRATPMQCQQGDVGICFYHYQFTLLKWKLIILCENFTLALWNEAHHHKFLVFYNVTLTLCSCNVKVFVLPHSYKKN